MSFHLCHDGAVSSPPAPLAAVLLLGFSPSSDWTLRDSDIWSRSRGRGDVSVHHLEASSLLLLLFWLWTDRRARSISLLLPSSRVSRLGVSVHPHACSSASLLILSQTPECGLAEVPTFFWTVLNSLYFSLSSLSTNCFYTFTQEI